MSEPEQLLKELVEALEGAFISTWQSTHHWQIQLNAARAFLDEKERKE
jgi:hypothetical protein